MFQFYKKEEKVSFTHSQETKDLLSKLAKERSTSETVNRILESDGYKQRLEKYKWKQIVNSYKNQQELLDLFTAKQVKELSQLWNCSVDCVRMVRKKLGLGKKNLSQLDIIKIHTKEQLEDLYFNKFDRHLKVMAESLNVYQDTLSKVFKRLGIEQKPHHPTDYEEVRTSLSIKAKERAKISNPIESVFSDPKWHETAVNVRQENGTYKRPHTANRKIEDIPEDKLKLEVLNRGVLNAAKFFGISQSTLREWCWKSKVKLTGGPRPILTETEEYIEQLRKHRMNQKFPFSSTSIELAIQNELTRRGIKFETQKPLINLTISDIFIESSIVIYCDGCWWHCCPICNLKYTNFEARGRDSYVNEGLKRANYKVFRFWEHDIKKDVKLCVDEIEKYITSQKDANEKTSLK